MNRRIVLWEPTWLSTTDEAGISIEETVLPPNPPPGPYERPLPAFSYVPPLSFLCVMALVPFPEQVHTLDAVRMLYRPPKSTQMFDPLRALVPGYDPTDADAHPDLSLLDPRLWAVVAQVYTNLPAAFKTYRAPLSDAHVPLLQRIPPTSHFALVTVLDLPGCRHLTDGTIKELKHLDTLSALDASGTCVSADGIRVLVRTMTWGESHDGTRGKRGPWGLRILCLRNCGSVDDAVFKYLRELTLLSVVDLRGTRCESRPYTMPDFFSADEFLQERFYHPTPIVACLANLVSDDPVFPTQNTATLHIDSTSYDDRPNASRTRRAPRRPPDVALQDSYVVLPHSSTRPAGKPQKVVVGNSAALDDLGTYDVFHWRRMHEQRGRRHGYFGSGHNDCYERAGDPFGAAMWDDCDERTGDPIGGPGAALWEDYYERTGDPFGWPGEAGLDASHSTTASDSDPAPSDEDQGRSDRNRSESEGENWGEDEDGGWDGTGRSEGGNEKWGEDGDDHSDDDEGLGERLASPQAHEAQRGGDGTLQRHTAAAAISPLPVHGHDSSEPLEADVPPARGHTPIASALSVERELGRRMLLDWQNSIAGEVASESSRRRAALAFHQRPSAPPHRSHHLCTAASARDSALMLYRPPPAWDVLASMREAVVMKRRWNQDDAPAMVNRASAAAKAFLAGVETWSKRAVVDAQQTCTREAAPRSGAPKRRRNIFARAVLDDGLRRASASKGMPEKAQERPVRPISLIPKPPWPNISAAEHFSPAVAVEASGHAAQSQITPQGKLLKGQSQQSTCSTGPLLHRVEPKSSRAAKRTAPRKHSAKRDRPEVTQTGFDWKRWGQM